jgi:hypothetical protein
MQYNTNAVQIVPVELSSLLTDTDINKPARNQCKDKRKKPNEEEISLKNNKQ